MGQNLTDWPPQYACYLRRYRALRHDFLLRSRAARVASLVTPDSETKTPGAASAADVHAALERLSAVVWRALCRLDEAPARTELGSAGASGADEAPLGDLPF